MTTIIIHNFINLLITFSILYSCGYDGRSIVFHHLMICGVQCRSVPVTPLMIHSCGTVIWHKNLGNTAEVFIHMDMGSNPCLLFFIDEFFHVGIHAVSHDTYKNPYICDLTSVRINNVSRITCPVNFNLFTRIS